MDQLNPKPYPIDDHSRLGFACLLPDERTPSVLTALRQAVAFYRDHNISIQRILTDRSSTYPAWQGEGGGRKQGP